MCDCRLQPYDGLCVTADYSRAIAARGRAVKVEAGHTMFREGNRVWFLCGRNWACTGIRLFAFVQVVILSLNVTLWTAKQRESVTLCPCPEQDLGIRHHTRRIVNTISATNIVFIKVHKAGSTTVSNLLARYALNHDLNVALPEQAAYSSRMFHCFGPFREEHVMPLADGQRFNLLFNHMVYNRSALDRVMPSDTFYLAIMRQPQDLFFSAAYYFSNLKQPKVNNTKNKEVSRLIARLKTKGWEYHWYVPLAFDTGLPLSLIQNPTAVERHVWKLDRELDLVMVMEHFHESLVLLKRKAGLSLRDIVFLKANARRNINVHNLTGRDAAELRALQAADHALYDHFYAKFWAEVGKEGPGYYRELACFKDTVSEFSEYCSSSRSHWDTFVVARSEWSEEFTLNARDCELMRLRELKFQNLLLRRAKQRQNKGGYRETRAVIPKWKAEIC